jgi:hypothetical protein
MASITPVAVGQTPTAIPLPAGVTTALVLNSGAVDVAVDDNEACSIDPLMGWRLQPGESFGVPVRSGVLYAAAAGEGGQVTLELPEHEPED